MRTLRAAYRDWWRSLFALRMIVLGGFVIILALAVADKFVPERLWDENLVGYVLGLVDDALWAFLLTPVVIAVHRFVIQGEITRAYALPVGDPTFAIFFAWLFGLRILVGLPIDLLVVMQGLDWPPWASTLGALVALIAAIALSLRLSILLPALAVKAPGATPSNALADTRSQALRIFAVFILALVPWAIADIVITLLLGRGIAVIGSPRMMIDLVIGAVSQTGVLILSAAIASHAFRLLADQINRAPKLRLTHPLSKHHSVE
ncbi:MAG: hypothetical protein WA652_10140 [Xanthobacteraceae bacterium]